MVRYKALYFLAYDKDVFKNSMQAFAIKMFFSGNWILNFRTIRNDSNDVGLARIRNVEITCCRVISARN